MKIGRCLVASDPNPLYLDFFPLVHRAWRDVVGVKLDLILIAEKIPEQYLAYRDSIILFPPIEGVHTGFQAQCARVLLPQLVRLEADEAVIISDIDMVPMNKRYYINSISKLTSDQFVVYRANVLREFSEIAICYNAALPETWGDLFGKIGNLAEAAAKIKRWHDVSSYDGSHGGAGWSTDQKLLFNAVEEFNPDRITRLTDKQLGFARLDRKRMKSKLSLRQQVLVRGRYYSDCHMKRPYSEFVELNQNVVDWTTKTIMSKLLNSEIIEKLS